MEFRHLFFNTAVFVIAFFIVIYLCKMGNRVLNFAYLLYMVITLGFICMSGQEYDHYGMIIVPMITYPIASLFGEVEIKDANEIRDMVDGYTDPDDTISVYGNWNFLYVMCDRKHDTRYSYQFPISQIMPRIMDGALVYVKR